MGRRTETTEYLKECLADALLYLMQTTPIDKITVQGIAEQAGVGRATYFRYFTSKADVLSFKLALLWERWKEEHPVDQRAARYEYFLQFFLFGQSIRPLLLFLRQRGQETMMFHMFLSSFVQSRPEQEEASYLHLYTSFGMVGVMMGWIQNGFQETPEELASICTK